MFGLGVGPPSKDAGNGRRPHIFAWASVFSCKVFLLPLACFFPFSQHKIPRGNNSFMFSLPSLTLPRLSLPPPSTSPSLFQQFNRSRDPGLFRIS